MSLIVHAAILTGAVLAGTSTDELLHRDPSTRVIPMPVFQPARPTPPARAPVQQPSKPEPVTTAPVIEAPSLPTVTEVPSALPPVSDAPPTVEPTASSTSAPSSASTGSVGGEHSDPFGGALGMAEVDEAATLPPRSPLPRYPDMLKSQRIEGTARLRFVVGANGRVELSTVVVVEASHPAFAESVRATLPRLRFRPARAGGRPVRQLVEFPVAFRLQP